MVEIPDELASLFTGTVMKRDESYVIEIPASEVRGGPISSDTAYRVALLPQASESDSDAVPTTDNSSPKSGPPVSEGERRTLEIETVGDQGDGIAKIERGYVVIVPGARPGEEPRVEIETVKPNVAFAEIVRSGP